MPEMYDTRDQYEIRIQPLPAKLTTIGNTEYTLISFVYEVWTQTMFGPQKLTTGTVSPFDVGRWSEARIDLLPGSVLDTRKKAMELAEGYVDNLRMHYRAYMYPAS